MSTSISSPILKPPFGLIDTHAHLSTPSLRVDLEAMLARAQTSGVREIVNICTNPTELEHGLVLSQQHPWIKLAAATTPHDVEKEGELHFPAIEKVAREGHLVAIGETGLDYHYTYSARDIQQTFLKRYLALTLSCHLPIIIHCREAFEDLLSILDTVYAGGRGVLHCFTGTPKEALELVDRGWFISFSGILTFKKSEALREAARLIPLSHLLIETDTPYLAPQKHRGKQNEPSFIGETAHCLSEIKNVSLEELSSVLRENYTRLFRGKKEGFF